MADQTTHLPLQRVSLPSSFLDKNKDNQHCFVEADKIRNQDKATITATALEPRLRRLLALRVTIAKISLPSFPPLPGRWG